MRKMLKRHKSEPQKILYETIKKSFRNYRVLDEYYIGEGLYLDFYLPDFICGVELHGKQHYEFSPLFHATAEGWEDQKRRDKRKEEICDREDITLIIFKYDEPISDSVYILDKITSALGG
jgi:very-short-patch-repair endonuclease